MPAPTCRPSCSPALPYAAGPPAKSSPPRPRVHRPRQLRLSLRTLKPRLPRLLPTPCTRPACQASTPRPHSWNAGPFCTIPPNPSLPLPWPPPSQLRPTMPSLLPFRTPSPDEGPPCVTTGSWAALHCADPASHALFLRTGNATDLLAACGTRLASTRFLAAYNPAANLCGRPCLRLGTRTPPSRDLSPPACTACLFPCFTCARLPQPFSSSNLDFSNPCHVRPACYRH